MGTSRLTVQQIDTNCKSILSVIMSTSAYTSGATRNPGLQGPVGHDSKNPYDPAHGRHAAVSLLTVFQDLAQVHNVYDVVTTVTQTDAQALALRIKEPTPVGAGANPDQYRIDLKRFERQQDGMTALKMDIRDRLTKVAWDHMLAITGSGMNTTLDAREVYWAFSTAFCTLSDREKTAALEEVRIPWAINTSLYDHIIKHALARHDLDAGGNPASQMEKVQELEHSLRNLFVAGVHFASKDSIETEFKASRNKANAFNLYMQILMTRVQRGEFADVCTPLPPAKVNAVKERSAGGAASGMSFPERSRAAKTTHSLCPLDSDCPVHVNRNKSGTVHKWRDCSLYKGIPHRMPDGK